MEMSGQLRAPAASRLGDESLHQLRRVWIGPRVGLNVKELKEYPPWSEIIPRSLH